MQECKRVSVACRSGRMRAAGCFGRLRQAPGTGARQAPAMGDAMAIWPATIRAERVVAAGRGTAAGIPGRRSLSRRRGQFPRRGGPRHRPSGGGRARRPVLRQGGRLRRVGRRLRLSRHRRLRGAGLGRIRRFGLGTVASPRRSRPPRPPAPAIRGGPMLHRGRPFRAGPGAGIALGRSAGSETARRSRRWPGRCATAVACTGRLARAARTSPPASARPPGRSLACARVPSRPVRAIRSAGCPRGGAACQHSVIRRCYRRGSWRAPRDACPDDRREK